MHTSRGAGSRRAPDSQAASAGGAPSSAGAAKRKARMDGSVNAAACQTHVFQKFQLIQVIFPLSLCCCHAVMTYERIGRVRKRTPWRNPAVPAPLPAGEVEAAPSQPHLPLLPPRPRVHPPLAPLLLLRRALLTQPRSLALPLALALLLLLFRDISRFPDHFPLELTGFFPGKHFIHFLVLKIKDFRNFVLHNCIIVFDAEPEAAEQVYLKLQVNNLKNQEVTVNPKPQTLAKNWFFENPIPYTLYPIP